MWNNLGQRDKPQLETCLGQTHTFYIVPDGIIGNIPFSILVTKKPVSDNPDYKDVEWLSRQFATVYLPSVNSLRALRRVDHVIDEPRAFVGVGDPVLRGSASVPRDSHVEATLPKGQLDLKGIRSLPALPEAARELKAMAHALHADEQSSLFLEQRASKTVLFRAPELGKAQIIAFATHGLMSGDFGLQEPALVLTPQLPEDDGLLKVSDILGLHLNAEWVVLSACNTAAGDIGAYNGISSLASAFF
jgi:CHAT domain-containing protein